MIADGKIPPEVAALNMGSMNYAKYSPKRKDFVFDLIFANPFGEIIQLRARYYEGVLPPVDTRFKALDSQRRLRMEQRQTLNERLQRLLVEPRPDFLQTADGRIGQMIGALTNRSTYADEDWLVIVLSDHGNHDGSIPDTRLTFHVLSGPSVQRGFMWPTPSIVDVFPTVFAHLGVPTNPAWNLDGRIEALLDLRPTYGTNLIRSAGSAMVPSTVSTFITRFSRCDCIEM